MTASTDAEDWKLWPPLIQKHFKDVLVEEEAKGNMPSGQLKKGFGQLSKMSSINEQEKPIAKINYARNIKG